MRYFVTGEQHRKSLINTLVLMFLAYIALLWVSKHGARVHARSTRRADDRSLHQYVGSSPYGSPAILCGIAHMQTDEGIWYPLGGTRAVPEALVKLATELGVQFTPG